MQETKQVTQPLHIENTVLQMGRQDLSINNAFNTYREMKLDGIISGSVSFIKAVLSKGNVKIAYHPKSTDKEKKVIDALNASLDNMEDYDKKRLVSNWLQILDYGCSLNELVYERKGGVFVFKTISPIHLTTVNKFEMQGGGLKRLKLEQAENDGLVVNVGKQPNTISGDKVLFFTNSFSHFLFSFKPS